MGPRSRMVPYYSLRAKSVDPCMFEGSLSEHVDHLVERSRARSMAREVEVSNILENMDKYSLPSSSLVWNSWTPWSRTGAFYFPRYPESWQGSSLSYRPRSVYWRHIPGPTYLRSRLYTPRYYPRYRSRFYR